MSFSEWKEARLEEICDIVMGQSPKGENCNNIGNGTPLLNGPTEFGMFHPQAIQFTTDVKKQSMKGDLLFCVRGSTTGRMNWANKEYAIGRGLATIRHKKGIDYNHFVKGLIDYKLDEILNCATGSTFPNVGKDLLNSLLVYVPPLEEQKAIADTLSCLDDKIELNNHINKTLEEMAQAIFKSWFVEFEPFQDGEFEESEMGRIPKGWKVDSLEEHVISIDNRGKTPPLVTQMTPYPIIDVKALSGESRIIDYNNCTKYVEKDTYNNWFRNGHPKQQDILISTVGSLAEMKLFYGDKGCIAQNVVGFRSKGISPLYLYQYLKYIKSDLISYNIGSVQPSIKVTHIIKHKILIPCDSELKAFEVTINEISSMIFKNFKETQILTVVRNTLLPKLMSGEIRVPLTEVQ